MVYTSSSPEETEAIGALIAATIGPGSIVVLKGSLGSGKTVLVKGIAKALGITEPVTSPSFTIVSEYRGEVLLRHIDLYRTGSDEELELLGFDELTDGSAVAVIEWGEKAGYFVPNPDITVEIRIEDGRQRIIEVQ